jgi:hypothetical protein
MNIYVSKELNNIFIDEMKTKENSYLLYETFDESKKRLYMLNHKGRKLLQLVMKEEPFTKDHKSFIQIKLIPYKFSFVNVHKDNLCLPEKYRIQDDINFTYHGGALGDKNPKIQLKAETKIRQYQTLVDSSFTLTDEELLLVPICSLYPGYLSTQPCIDEVKKQGYKFVPSVEHFFKIDIFFSGIGFNLYKYFETMVSFNMFFDLDFMIAQDKCPINYCKMTNPITGYKINNYHLFVRSSISIYRGRPFLQFYDNNNYYQKFMNRNVAIPNDDKSVTWSNMHEEEKRINNSYYKPPNA